jgi:hypothetical protein
MNTNKMGRPAKPAAKRKRIQYSVWVNAEEKILLDKLIADSNQSASQFFLTLAIEKPTKNPVRKNIPNSIATQITNLEKLAGVLTNALLKTNGRDLTADNWKESSVNVKWISKIVLLRIFQEFEYPAIKSTLHTILEQSILLNQMLVILKIDNPPELLAILKKIIEKCDKLNVIFSKQFKENEVLSFPKLWKEEFDVHAEILKLKNNL